MSKKQPMRQCISCREMKAKPNLIRIVKSPESIISPDFTGKMPGRGAYICKTSSCIERAEKSKALSRAFKMATPNEIWIVMQKTITTDLSGQ